MAELINLSFNMHCYSLVTQFSDINKVGKDLYLSERQAVASKEFDELDGEAYAMEVIKSNPYPRITPYGVLYKNNNQPAQVYNGRNFPPYGWQESIATVELRVKDESEFIYFPCFDTDIQKALMRLEVSNLSDCEITIDNYNFPNRILNIISDDTPLQLNIDTLNDMASKLKGMGTKDIKYFENLMEYVKPKTIDEILALTDSMYEFEIYNKVTDGMAHNPSSKIDSINKKRRPTLRT